MSDACERDRIIAKLRRIGACREAIRWVRSQPRDATLERLWVACQSPEWMCLFTLRVAERGRAAPTPAEITRAARRWARADAKRGVRILPPM